MIRSNDAKSFRNHSHRCTHRDLQNMCRQPHRRHRTGAILAAVLACLVISLALVFSSLALSIRSQREAKSVGIVYQTAFLLDAGVERALDQLQKSNDYQGEIWKPTFLTAFDSSQPGIDCSIEIRLTPEKETESQENLQVDVIARIESNGTSLHPVQQTRQFQYRIPKT